MYALMETVPNWKDEAKFARVVAVVARPVSCMPRLQHLLGGQACQYMALWDTRRGIPQADNCYPLPEQ